MRGEDRDQTGMFSYISPEKRVPKDHPLRAMRQLVDIALLDMDSDFRALYSKVGRPSIAPEKLLRALVLQVLYSVRSERLLMEQLDYNLLFRWFVGLDMDDTVWAPTVFSKNRERLLDGEIAAKFFDRILENAREFKLLSDEHFTVDGTLIEAWAGHKSFKSKGGGEQPPSSDGTRNPDTDFTGQKRSNKTHESTTDPDAKLYRKSHGTESKLCYAGHVLMDNKYGLAVDGLLTQATGRCEPEAALEMVHSAALRSRVTIGADKAYDTRSFVQALRRLKITPHIAGKNASYSMIDARTTRHPGYEVSQRKRKRIEEIFGWMKTVGVMRKTRHRGSGRVGWMFMLTLATYNLVRIRNLLWSPG